MNIVFFIIITMILLSFLIPNFRKKCLLLLLLIFITLLLIYPQLSLNSAKDGIDLWIFVVVPSLLPFFIVNDMLISLKFPEIISRCLSPIAKVMFNTSGYGVYVFVMSIFSGYPAGAKITEQLIKGKKITSNEGQKILTFSSTSGPLFIIGAVGSGMLHNSFAGYLLYICHISGAILNGLLLQFFFSKEKHERVQTVTPTPDNSSSESILSNAILNSLITCGFIGGYIILFSVIISLLNKIGYFSILTKILRNYLVLPSNISDILSYTLQAALEISNGSKIISTAALTMEIKLVILSFIIAFSGLSVIGQVSSIIRNTTIDIKKYVLAKLGHGILSALICFILIKFNIFNIPTYTETSNYMIPNEIFLIDLLLIIMLAINIYGKIKFKIKQYF